MLSAHCGRQDTTLSQLAALSRALRVSVSDLCAYAEGLDAREARWRQLYQELSDEERDAALKIMDRGATYRVTPDKS